MLGHIVKMHHFFNNKSSSLFTGIDQTKYIVCSYDQLGRVYQIVNFMTPGARVLVLRRGQISYVVKIFGNNGKACPSIVLIEYTKSHCLYFLSHRGLHCVCFFKNLYCVKNIGEE